MKYGKLLGLTAMTVVSLSAWGQRLYVGPVYEGDQVDVEVVVEVRDVGREHLSKFTLLENQNATIDAQSREAFWETPHNMALVISVDVSGTMRGAPLRDVKSALKEFLRETLDPRVPVALVAFADKAEVVAGFEQGARPNLLRAIDSLRATGNSTVLYDAVQEAVNQLAAPGLDTASAVHGYPGELPARKRIIVISDGKDEGSVHNVKKVTQSAVDAQVRIDAVGRSNIESGFAEVLGRFGDRTGGYYMEPEVDGQTVPVIESLMALHERWMGLVDTPTSEGVKYEGTLVLKFLRDAADLLETELTKTVGVSLNRGEHTPLADAVEAAIRLTKPEVNVVEKPVITTEIVEVEKTDWGSILWAVSIGLGLSLTWVIYWLKPLGGKPGSPPTRAPRKPRARKQAPDNLAPPLVNPPPASPPPAAVERGARVTRIGAYFQPPKPRRPSLILLGVEGPARGQRYPLQRPKVRVGAGADNDWVVARDEYVSAHHALLRYEEGTVFIDDLQSKNGTYVNDARVMGTSKSLNLGDRIRLGDSVFEVLPGKAMTEPESGTAVSPAAAR